MSETSSAAAAATPEYMQKAKTRVRVFTPSGVIEGDYSHPPGVRLSDSLRNSATGERFMLLTDVTIRSVEGNDIDAKIDSAPFVLLSTSHASLLVPLAE